MANTKLTQRLSSQFVHSIGTYGEFVKANVHPSLFNPFGNDTFAGMMMSMGREETVDTLKGTYFEETRSNIAITATGSASASAGDTVTQTVVAGDRYAIGYDPYAGTGTSSTVVQPQKGDVLMYPNGVQGIVLTDPDGSYQFTVTPLDETESIPAVTSGELVINLGQRTKEGSAPPKATSYVPTEFEWAVAMKQSYSEWTDTQLVEPILIGDGKWTFKNWDKVLNKHQKELGAELLVGKKMTNPNALAVFEETPSFNGYIPYVESYGREYAYDSVGGLTKADLDQYIIDSAEYGSPNEVGVYGSTRFILQTQELLKDLSGAGASFTSFGNGEMGKEVAVNLNHKSVTLGDYTLHLKTLNEFNDPEMLGATGHVYGKFAMFIPLNKAGADSLIKTLAFDDGSGNMGYQERFMSGLYGNNDLNQNIESYNVTTRKGIMVNGQKQHAIFKPE